MKEIRPVSSHSISRHSCGHFKIYPRPQITNYCREDKIKIFPSIILATLNREKTRPGKENFPRDRERGRKSPARLASVPRKGREPEGKKERRKGEAKSRGKASSAVLVGQPDSSKGEHPVHANDIPEVQRAVFRGYQRRP